MACHVSGDRSMTKDNDEYPDAPDLQEWVDRYGGYWNIPWPEWDAALARWHIARRLFTAGHVNDEQNDTARRKRAKR